MVSLFLESEILKLLNYIRRKGRFTKKETEVPKFWRYIRCKLRFTFCTLWSLTGAVSWGVLVLWVKLRLFFRRLLTLAQRNLRPWCNYLHTNTSDGDIALHLFLSGEISICAFDITLISSSRNVRSLPRFHQYLDNQWSHCLVSEHFVSLLKVASRNGQSRRYT